LEELTLRFYSILFSIFFLIIYIFYLFNFKSIKLDDQFINIKKNESIHSVANNIIKNENFFHQKIFYLSFILSNNSSKKINYGDFKINKNSSFVNILKIITKKSNIDYKLTIVEGWESYQLDKYLFSYYPGYEHLPYNGLIADTYIINSSNSFEEFKKFLEITKDNFFDNYKNNELIKKYGFNNILIIASLVEKEAKNNEDKSLISSIIFNRLDSNMRLQIDATVISAITKGKYKLDRELTYEDLKINDILNTYVIDGIPPKMISYVGKKTVEIILENNKSDFLFYFYNILEKKHIFSKNYQSHRKKLNEYRKKTK